MSWVSVSRYNYLITRLRTQCGLPDLILLAKWWWWHNIATNNQGCCWPYVQCHIPAFVVTGVHSIFYCSYKCFKFTRNCILIKSIQRKSCLCFYVNPNTFDICLIPWNIWSILIFSWPWERSRRYVGPEGGGEGGWHPPAPTESLLWLRLRCSGCSWAWAGQGLGHK